jgi:acetyl esterase/lipase
MWLSVLDAAAGGGAGAERAASGLAFGSHGQRLDVWPPTDTAAAARPVVVFYYGGGWVKGTRAAYAFVRELMHRTGSKAPHHHAAHRPRL